MIAKGCRSFIKNRLKIDKTILSNCRKANKNLAIIFIDYKKAYDMVPHSCLKETQKPVGVADNICRLFSQSMCNWKTVLTSNGDILDEIFIQCGIFQ